MYFNELNFLLLYIIFDFIQKIMFSYFQKMLVGNMFAFLKYLWMQWFIADRTTYMDPKNWKTQFNLEK